MGVNKTRTGILDLLIGCGARIRTENVRDGIEPCADIVVEPSTLAPFEIISVWSRDSHGSRTVTGAAAFSPASSNALFTCADATCTVKNVGVNKTRTGILDLLIGCGARIRSTVTGAAAFSPASSNALFTCADATGLS